METIKKTKADFQFSNLLNNYNSTYYQTKR